MTRISEHDLAQILKTNPELAVHETIVRQRTAIPAHVGNDKLANEFEALWAQLGGPSLQREYRFHTERKWRFDYAIPEAHTAIELEGGLWSGGRHIRPLGFAKDAEKYNAAAAAGWTVFRLATGQVTVPNIEMILLYLKRGAK